MAFLIITVVMSMSISAICSIFEAILYSVPLRHIESLEKSGSASAKVLKKLRMNVDRPITAILSLNTVATTAGATIAGAAAVTVFGESWMIIFSICFTLAMLLFSEIIPKTIGLAYNKTLMPLASYGINFLVIIMSPLIRVITILTSIISKNNKAEEVVTDEELIILAGLSRSSGAIALYQEKTIEGVLTFAKKSVKDVMTPRTVVFSRQADMTLDETAKSIDKWEHSRFPIWDKDQEDIIGIAFTKDVFMSIASGYGNLKLRDLLRPVRFAAETAPLSKIFREFLDTRQHLFVVIDEYGGLSGIITLEDVLEEMLGREIMDESDQVADKREFAKQRRRI